MKIFLGLFLSFLLSFFFVGENGVFAHEQGEKNIVTKTQAKADFDQTFWMASSEVGKKETLKEFSSGDENFRLIAADGRSYSFMKFTDRELICLIAYQQKANALDRKGVLLRAQQMARELGKRGHVLLLQLGPTDRDQLLADTRPYSLLALEDSREIISRSFGFKKLGDFVMFQSIGENQTPQRLSSGNVFKTESVFSPMRWMDQLFSFRHLNYQIDREFGGKIQYSAEIRGAFERQCQFCHSRYPEIDFYQSKKDFKYWANMNKFVMRTMRMPPSGVDPDARYSLCDVDVKNNARDLRDLWLLQNWFEAGSPIPEKAEYVHLKAAPLKQPPPPEIIFKMERPHVVEANGIIDYKIAKLAGPTTQDYYVKGFWGDFNLNVAHHVNILVTDKIRAQLSMRKTKEPLDRDLAARDPHSDLVEEFVVTSFSRRKGMARFPKGTAYFIPKGSYILLEFHYNPSGKREINQAQLGMYLAAPETIPHLQLLNRMRIRRVPFTIPAESKDFKLERTLEIKEPITLIQAWSHSHFRAVASSITGELPDGTRIPICNTPYYQFKYEINPALGKEVFLPAGSKIHSTIWYDNSGLNPANPDPKQSVANGYQTDSQEMDIIRFVYVKGKLRFPLEAKIHKGLR